MDVFIRDISLAFSAHNFASNKDELQCLNNTYDKILRSLIDKYAPLKTRYVSDRAKAPWINEEILNGKRVKR